jgi:hypothetical protein
LQEQPLAPHQGRQPGPRPRAAVTSAVTSGAVGAVELASPRAQQIDEVGGRSERIGDDGAVCEGQRRHESPVEFGEQDGLRRGHRAVERRKSRKRRLIGGAAVPKRHRIRAIRPMSRECDSASDRSSAEPIGSCLRDSALEVWGDHVRVLSGR